MISEITTSTGGSSSRRRISPATRPTTTPMTIPPTAAMAKTATALDRTNAPADGRDDRRPIGDERGGVVEQGLALDERPDDPRRPDPAEDRGGRERIRRPDDRAQGEGSRPVQPGDDRVGRRGHDDDRDDHQADREAAERGQIRAQVPDRRLGRGREQQRRQEDEQDQLGLEPDLGHPRHETEEQAAQDEQRRIRDAGPPGKLIQDRDRDQDDQDGGQDFHESVSRSAAPGSRPGTAFVTRGP